MPFVELKLCEKVGKILIEAKKLYKGNDLMLVVAWMNSNVFSEIIAGNEIYCSQAKTYVARCFMEKNKIAGDSEKIELDDDVLYWFGYLVTYWCFSQGIVPSDISRHYDIESILNAYEMLHTLSVKTAIEKIMGEYRV